MNSLKTFTYLLLLCGVFLWGQLDQQLEQKIRGFIIDLESEDQYVQKHASNKLIEIGSPALPFLQGLMESNPNIAWRVEKLIEQIKAQPLKKKKKQSRKRRKFSKKYEFKGPGFQFRFRFGEMDDVFKELQKNQKWKRLQQFGPSSSLTVVDNHKRYEFDWLNKKTLKITTTDFKTQTVKKYQVKSLKELKQKYPALYKVYINNGGNSLLKRFLDDNNIPRNKLFRRNRMFRNLPQQFQRELDKLEEEMNRSLAEAYEMEEKFKKEMRDWDTSRDFMDKLKKNSPGEFDYGVQLRSANPVIRSQLQLDDDEGVIVVKVADEGLLVKAGIQQWDLLLKINGKKITRPNLLVYLIGNMLSGEEGVIEIIRQGERLKIKFIK